MNKSQLLSGDKVENDGRDTSASGEFSHTVRCFAVHEMKKDDDGNVSAETNFNAAKNDDVIAGLTKAFDENFSLKRQESNGETDNPVGTRGPDQGKPAGVSSKGQPPAKFTRPHDSGSSFSTATTYSTTENVYPDYSPSYGVQLTRKVAQNYRTDSSSASSKFKVGPPKNHFETRPQLAPRPEECYLTNGNVVHDRFGKIISNGENPPGLQCSPSIRQLFAKKHAEQPSQYVQPHQFYGSLPLSSTYGLTAPSVQNHLQNFVLPQQRSQLPIGRQYQQQAQQDQLSLNYSQQHQQWCEILNSSGSLPNSSLNFGPQHPSVPAGFINKQNFSGSWSGQTPYRVTQQLPLQHQQLLPPQASTDKMQTANNSSFLNSSDFIPSFDSFFSKNINVPQKCNKVSKVPFNGISKSNNSVTKVNNQPVGSGSGFLAPIEKINNLSHSADLYSSSVNFVDEIIPSDTDLEDLLHIFADHLDEAGQHGEDNSSRQFQKPTGLPEITSSSCRPPKETNSLLDALPAARPGFPPTPAGTTSDRLNYQNDFELNCDKAEFERILMEYRSKNLDFCDLSVGDEFQFEKLIYECGDLIKKTELSRSYSSITDSLVENDLNSVSPVSNCVTVDDDNCFGSLGYLDDVQLNPDLFLSWNEPELTVPDPRWLPSADRESSDVSTRTEAAKGQPVPVSCGSEKIQNVARQAAASDSLNQSDSYQLRTLPNGGDSSLEEERKNVMNQKYDVLNFLTQDEDGDNALHRAVIDGDLEAVNSILTSLSTVAALMKKVVEMKNNMAQTPLCMAVVENQPSIVRSLVRSGADISVTIHSRQGRTQNNGAKETLTFTRPLHFSAARGQEWIDCLKELLASKDYDVNAKDSKGKTALHCAIEAHRTSGRHGTIDSMETVKLLIQSGADHDEPDGCFDMTALHYAVKSKSVAMVSCLLNSASMRCLKMGAAASPSKSPNLAGERSPGHARKLNNRTPGQAEGGTALTKMLNATTGTGYNALHLAVSLDMKPELDHLRLIQLLLKGGADPSAKNSEGQLPRELTKNENVIKILRGIGLGAPRQNPQIVNHHPGQPRTPASLGSPSTVSCYSVSPSSTPPPRTLPLPVEMPLLRFC